MTKSSLPIPEAIESDPAAVEMLRAWVSNKDLVCALNIGVYVKDGRFNEGRAWGVILGDLARHACKALQSRHGMNDTETMKVLREAFMAHTSLDDDNLVEDER